MKKILLSFGVIFIFAIYAMYEKSAVQTPTLGEPTNVSTDMSTSDSSNSNDQATTSSGSFKDGEYTGSRTDAFYGFIRVKASIKNGKISDIIFLEYPNDRDTSQEINETAIPLLKSEAIKSQSSQVDIISGATQSSEAFRQSLQSALDQAKS